MWCDEEYWEEETQEDEGDAGSEGDGAKPPHCAVRVSRVRLSDPDHRQQRR